MLQPAKLSNNQKKKACLGALRLQGVANLKSGDLTGHLKILEIFFSSPIVHLSFCALEQETSEHVLCECPALCRPVWGSALGAAKSQHILVPPVRNLSAFGFYKLLVTGGVLDRAEFCLTLCFEVIRGRSKMAERLAQLILEQMALLDGVRDMLRNFRKDVTRRTEAHLEARLESLGAFHDEFRQNHRELVRAGHDDVVKKDYVSAGISSLFEEAYIDVVAEVKTDLSCQRDIMASTAVHDTSMNRTVHSAIEEVKLPTIKLPVFSGKFVDWPVFKELFLSRVHNCERLNDLHRFHYLKDSLSEEVAKDIQHLTLIESNYHKAWDMLVDMYDNKRVLFQHYMDVFEKQAAVQHGDPNALKQFVQTCRASVTSLEKIGVDLQRHGQILVYYMTRKLSGQLRLEWEKSTTKRELPTFEDLCAYLDIQYRTMITASFYGSDPASTKERRNTSQSDKGTTVTRDDSSCPVCGHGNHLITDCKQFAGMGVSDRMATVRKYRLCFICLDNKHQASKCGSRRYCERCTGRHHTLIHVEKEKRTLGPPKPSEQSAQKVSTNLVNRFCALEQETSEHVLCECPALCRPVWGSALGAAKSQHILVPPVRNLSAFGFYKLLVTGGVLDRAEFCLTLCFEVIRGRSKMAERLAQLILEQMALLDGVRDMLRNFRKDVTRRTEAHLEARLESLGAFHDEFRQNHRELVRAGHDDVVKKDYVSAGISSLFEEAYIDVVAEVKTDLSCQRDIMASTAVHDTSMNRTVHSAIEEVKLPTIKLPVFSGKFVDWPVFKELFLSRVHNCERLNDLHRFHYLKDSLSEEVAKDIQHLTLIESNYHKAWDMLVDMYDNKRVLFQHYMDVFEKQAAVQHGDPNALKQFVQTCRASVTSLEKIGVDLQRHGQILVYYMTRKLSGQLRLEWEKSTTKRELPTFEDLCAYLDIQYRTMITASFYGSDPASTKERRNTSQSDKGTTVTRDDSSCPVCGHGNHLITDCKQFAGMGVSDRMATVRKYRLCFICLDNKHQASKCGSRRYCERCTGRHHTLIHVEKEKRTLGPPKPSEQSAQKVSTNLVNRFCALEQETSEHVLCECPALCRPVWGSALGAAKSQHILVPPVRNLSAFGFYKLLVTGGVLDRAEFCLTLCFEVIRGRSKMAERLAQLILEQMALLDGVRDMLRNFRKDVTRRTEAHLEARLESLGAFHDEFRQNHRELVRAGHDDVVKKDYVSAGISSLFEEAYIDVVAEVKTDLSCQRDIMASTAVHDTSMNRTVHSAIEEVKLPTIKLPVFSGKFVDWPVFKELFLSRVHNCERLNDLHRFHYLKDSLSEEVAKDIQHLTLIESNYHKAWDMLVDMYDNKRVLFQHYMDVFEKQAAVQHGDPNALKQFVQTCRASVTSLEKIGVDLQRHGQILVYYMTRKLSGQLRLEWEKSTTKRELPTFEDLCAYLDIQYRTMITASFYGSDPASTKERRNTSQSDKGTTVTRDDSSCPVCGHGNHLITDCKQFAGMGVSDRMATVRKYRLCFICLDNKHQASKCGSRRYCERCTGRHHTLIHVEKEKRTLGPPKPSEQSAQKVSTNLVNRFCALEQETSEHVLCECPALCRPVWGSALGAAKSQHILVPPVRNLSAFGFYKLLVTGGVLDRAEFCLTLCFEVIRGRSKMAERLAQLILEQMALLDGVRDMLRNFRKDVTRRTEAHLEARLESLGAFHDEFRQNHRELVRAGHDDVVKKDYVSAGISSLFEEAYIDVVAEVKTDLSCQRDIMASTAVHDTSMNRTVHSAIEEVKLPTIKLPVFSGKFVDWPVFKELFLSRVHNCERLNDLHRFHYLKDSLSEEVAKDIQHLTLIESNYHKAWDMLVDMYDNKRVLFQHYMDVFEKQAAVQHGDPNALKQFVQTCRASVTSLEKIGVDLQRHGQILVYYMTRKLSGQLRLEWEKSTTKRELPTFEDLCAYLDIQYRTMITASFYGSDPASTKERRNTSQSDKGTTVTRDDSSCPVCGHGNHLITDCKQFAGMGVSDRMATVRKYRLCFICLDNKHQASKCGSRRYCERCTGRHHTLIHVEKEKRTLGPPKPSEQSAQKVSTNLVNRSKKGSSTNGSNCDVLLPTAVVTVDNAEGVPLKFRAFLDQGSQASFISESAAQLLRLPRQKVHVKVNGLASSRITEVTTAMFICLRSRLDSQVKYNVQVYILPRVSHKMPDRQISEDMLPYLTNLCLADPNYFVPQGIDMLLGSDIYDELMLSEVHRGPTGAPLAQNTTLGYIVSGKISGRASPISSYTVKISRNEASNELEDLLQRFWELEQFDKESADLSEEERWCEEFFVRTHRRLPSGKYIVRLPFLTPLDSTMVLGESYRAALKRLCHLERRLRADDNLKEVYTATINEYLELGQMMPVKSSKDSCVRPEVVEGRLWKEGLKWDDQVSASIQKEWTKFINDLPYITEIRIPRYLNFGGTYASGQLHIFCDASAKAYGAVAYLRVQTSDHTYRSELLLAKYSMIVPSWIKGGAAKWKLFVSNRISKILETSETSQWRHVATADNPADHLSRGLSVNKLSSSELWWHGPQWLQAAESEWPTTEIDIGSTTEVSNEMKSVSSNRVSIEQMPHVNLLERYSSYTHMLRVIAYVQRFVRNCKVLRCERRTEGLSVDELSHSLRSVTRMVQLECFTADWKALQLGRALPKDSTLLSLNPYFDVDAQ
ncbi:hypothetical protein ACLKA6_002573, partial [Drosophila palustris]